jgi:hypothetical protein
MCRDNAARPRGRPGDTERAVRQCYTRRRGHVVIATWSGLLDRLDTLIGEDDNDLVLISSFIAFTVYCHIVPLQGR